MRASLLACCGLLAACSSSPFGDVVDPVALDAAVDRHLAARRVRLRAAQADFEQRVHLPRMHETDTGTLIVTRAELVGPMGGEFLRLRFTYVNGTTATFDRIRIHVTVRDGFGKDRGDDTLAIVMPLDYRFAPRTSFTDVMEVPTGGAHDTVGWDYRVELRGEQM